MIRYLLMVCLALGLGLGGLALAKPSRTSKRSACHGTVRPSCCCKKTARICACDHRSSSLPVILSSNNAEPSPVALPIGQLLVFNLLLPGWTLAPVAFSPTDRRARGPTSLGLTAFQFALPPPA